MRRGRAAAIAFLVLAPLGVFTRGPLQESARPLSARAAPAGAGGLHLVSRVIGATGVLRAIVLDGLWLRTLRLQRRGEHFEAALLAKAIARLEPRIDAAWTFQARHLAYDITPSFPPEERWPWVLESIEILRGEALPLNPDSIPIHLELAFIHHHKIGLDLDDAAPLYRSRLATLFEGKEGRDLAARHMDTGLLARLGAEMGAALDPRAAGSHALYWARHGLEAGNPGADPAGAAALERIDALSRIQLYHTGRPVRALLGGFFAFVPDLRFAGAADRAVKQALGMEGVDPAEAAETLQTEGARRILYLVISGRLEDARREHATRPGAPAFESVVFETAFGSLPASREGALEALASATEASVLVEVAGEEDLARGFGDLAEIAAARATAIGKATPTAREARSAVESRLRARWSARPAWQPLAARLPPAAGSPPELPDPDRLLFRLDLLDPALHPDPSPGARRASPGDARP